MAAIKELRMRAGAVPGGSGKQPRPELHDIRREKGGREIEVAGMSFWDKVVEFFKEDDSWMRKEPRQFQGQTYTAWDEKADARAAWPNAPCAKCGGIGLKKELYWNRESDTWYHPDCMTG